MKIRRRNDINRNNSISIKVAIISGLFLVLAALINGIYPVINTIIKNWNRIPDQNVSTDVDTTINTPLQGTMGTSQHRSSTDQNESGNVNNKSNTNNHSKEESDKPNKVEETISTTAEIIEIKTVIIKKGSFHMGSATDQNEDNKPTRQVTINHDVAVSVYETTFDYYEQFCHEKGIIIPDDNGWGKGSRPVINVSWFDAVKYCNWLSNKKGRKEAYVINNDIVIFEQDTEGYRLPTEAEWEYIASLTTQNTNISPMIDYSWSSSNSEMKSHNIGGKKDINGILDLYGNVAEWCWDWYAIQYPRKSEIDPSGPSSGDKRCIRGGSWKDTVDDISIVKRFKENPSVKNASIGFRVVYSIF